MNQRNLMIAAGAAAGAWAGVWWQTRAVKPDGLGLAAFDPIPYAAGGAAIGAILAGMVQR